jgi:hypothetical protein
MISSSVGAGPALLGGSLGRLMVPDNALCERRQSAEKRILARFLAAHR